jgi:putative endonuclease
MDPATSRRLTATSRRVTAISRRVTTTEVTVAKTAYVYILASKKNGTLYTGVTSDLQRRMYEHKHHLMEGFTHKYDVTRLVWFVQGDDIAAAIELEKKIKNRGRQWKIDLIEKSNPNWDDLSTSWMDAATALRSAQHDSGETE